MTWATQAVLCTGAGDDGWDGEADWRSPCLQARVGVGCVWEKGCDDDGWMRQTAASKRLAGVWDWGTGALGHWSTLSLDSRRDGAGVCSKSARSCVEIMCNASSCVEITLGLRGRVTKTRRQQQWRSCVWRRQKTRRRDAETVEASRRSQHLVSLRRKVSKVLAGMERWNPPANEWRKEWHVPMNPDLSEVGPESRLWAPA